jgi:hypothetical protein
LPKKSSDKKSGSDKDEDGGSSDNVDVALVIAKLNSFLQEQVRFHDD